MQAILDILHYAKELKEAGVPDQQAEIHAEKLALIIENNLATKHDIKLLETKIAAIDSKLSWLITLVGIATFILTLMNFFKPLFHS